MPNKGCGLLTFPKNIIIQNISVNFLEEEKKNAELDSMIQFVEINKGSRDCKT